MLTTALSCVPGLTCLVKTGSSPLNFGTVLLGLLVAVIFLAIQAFLVQLLWNTVIVKIFKTLPCIDFWKALGLIFFVYFLLP